MTKPKESTSGTVPQQTLVRKNDSTVKTGMIQHEVEAKTFDHEKCGYQYRRAQCPPFEKQCYICNRLHYFAPQCTEWKKVC